MCIFQPQATHILPLLALKPWCFLDWQQDMQNKHLVLGWLHIHVRGSHPKAAVIAGEHCHPSSLHSRCVSCAEQAQRPKHLVTRCWHIHACLPAIAAGALQRAVVQLLHAQRGGRIPAAKAPNLPSGHQGAQA